MKRGYLLTLLSLLFAFPALAQLSWEGGVFAGVGLYSGDITPTANPRFGDSDLSVGFFGRVPVTGKLNFRSSLIYAALKSDDANFPERESRAFSFRTNLVELNLVGEFEPFGANRYYSDAQGNLAQDKLISPYIYGGVGFTFLSLNPDFTKYQGTTLQPGIQRDRLQGNSKIAVVVPLGVGVKFDVTNDLTVGIDGGFRLTFTDYVDGISEAASTEGDDVYYMLGLLVGYRFNR